MNSKANELRVSLLFGYLIFVDVLHLAENLWIREGTIDKMQRLDESFVDSFPDLYTPRHCVQVVHSIVHIAATVQDFEPLTNYTTFHFESQLGKISRSFLPKFLLQGLLTRTSKSTRLHSKGKQARF